jgi:AcrR family transcriptional regulator
MMIEDTVTPSGYYGDVVFITVRRGSIDFAVGAQLRPRRYHSELRRQQAEQTRLRIVAAAAELFAELGYARTTLAKIAAAAGVSPETVQAHGPKAALMIAAVEYAAFAVTGDHNVLDLEVGQRFVAISDREDAVEFLVTEQTAVHERSARVTQALLGAAATDPDLDGYLNELIAGIGRQIRRLLEICRGRGWLRDDVPFDELVETVVVISSFETYSRIVHRDGWSLDAYRDWFLRMLHDVALRPTPGERQHKPRRPRQRHAPQQEGPTVSDG